MLGTQIFVDLLMLKGIWALLHSQSQVIKGPMRQCQSLPHPSSRQRSGIESSGNTYGSH